MSKVPQFLQNKSERTLALLLGVVILSLGVVFMALAWTEPSSPPTDGNVSAPINVSGVSQVKMGPLGIMTDGGTAGGYALSVGGSGTGDGLKVSGELNMDNHKISNVQEIDPVFGIDDKKYVTYMPDEIGQKVYVVGEDQLEGDKRVINLEQQPEGSDLWLFWKAVAHDSVVPFVSAQDSASLYAYMNDSNLVVEKRAGKEKVNFSLRLIGTRIDHADASDNLYSDQEVENYLDIEEEREK